MARKVPHGPFKGSQKWLHALVNQHTELLYQALNDPLKLAKGEVVEWLSPLTGDNFSEYSDSDFVTKLGATLSVRELPEFWPTGGAAWDALGRTQSGKLLLVEAKAHIAEMVSKPSCAKSDASVELIAESLRTTQLFMNAKPEIDWSQCFYQYCNRLAHLYLLRHVNRIPAHLVFVYFIGDSEVCGPQTEMEWRAAVEVLERFLGVTKHRLRSFIHHLYFDVSHLSSS